MRRFDLSPIVLLPLFSLMALAAACATAPVDEDPNAGVQVAEQNGNQPKEDETNSAKLPAPSSQPSNTSSTSSSTGGSTSSSSSGGSTSSSGGSTSSSGGSTSSSGGSTSSSGGSTSSSSGSSSGGAPSCDMNNPLNIAKAFAELDKPSPETCGIMGGSCSSGKCCFDVYGVCITP